MKYGRQQKVEIFNTIQLKTLLLHWNDHSSMWSSWVMCSLNILSWSVSCPSPNILTACLLSHNQIMYSSQPRSDYMYSALVAIFQIHQEYPVEWVVLVEACIVSFIPLSCNCKTLLQSIKIPTTLDSESSVAQAHIGIYTPFCTILWSPGCSGISTPWLTFKWLKQWFPTFFSASPPFWVHTPPLQVATPPLHPLYITPWSFPSCPLPPRSGTAPVENYWVRPSGLQPGDHGIRPWMGHTKE